MQQDPVTVETIVKEVYDLHDDLRTVTFGRLLSRVKDRAPSLSESAIHRELSRLYRSEQKQLIQHVLEGSVEEAERLWKRGVHVLHFLLRERHLNSFTSLQRTRALRCILHRGLYDDYEKEHYFVPEDNGGGRPKPNFRTFYEMLGIDPLSQGREGSQSDAEILEIFMDNGFDAKEWIKEYGFLDAVIRNAHIGLVLVNRGLVEPQTLFRHALLHHRDFRNTGTTEMDGCWHPPTIHDIGCDTSATLKLLMETFQVDNLLSQELFDHCFSDNVPHDVRHLALRVAAGTPVIDVSWQQFESALPIVHGRQTSWLLKGNQVTLKSLRRQCKRMDVSSKVSGSTKEKKVKLLHRLWMEARPKPDDMKRFGGLIQEIIDRINQEEMDAQPPQRMLPGRAPRSRAETVRHPQSRKRSREEPPDESPVSKKVKELECRLATLERQIASSLE